VDGPSDCLCQIEGPLSFSEKGMFEGDGSKKRSEKKGKKNRFRHRSPCFDHLVHKVEEGEKKFPGLFHGEAAASKGSREIWEKRKE